MDGKDSRQLNRDTRWRHYQVAKSRIRQFAPFFRTHYASFITAFLLLMLIVLLFGLVSLLPSPMTNAAPSGMTTIDYTTFVNQVKAGNMLVVTVQGNDAYGLLATPLSSGHSRGTVPRSSETVDIAAWNKYVSGTNSAWSSASASSIDPQRAVHMQLAVSGDAGFMQLLVAHHVTVNTLPVPSTPAWVGAIWRFLPIVLLIIVVSVLFNPRNALRSSRSVDDQMSKMGKSRVRRFDRTNESTKVGLTSPKTDVGTKVAVQARVSTEPTVTFADVAGIDEVRSELEEIVQFLRNPERFDRLGARIPRGALLVGPPGTGKTLLAKAVAGEAGVPFFSISASEFVEMFVGVGASRVRDLFNKARQAAPAVIFIDEIDAVGRKRSMRISGSDERDQTLNQLLVELDGFDSRKAVVVLAATNRVDILDNALLRPGRFDRHVHVSLPDRAGREAILRVHTRRTPLHEDVSLERLARLTTGMSGADLANLVNEAALSAARQNLDYLTHECFEEALARVQLGALRPLIMSEHDRKVIAYHEGGHALVAHYLPQADTVNRVTILPRGQSLGVTQFTSEEDRYNYSRDTLMARIAVGLGGRAAEELTFGPDYVTTGAENDFQVVTSLARRMVTRWGMSEQVGVVFADYEPGAASLNMVRVEPDTLQSRSLVMNSNGQLMLHGEQLTPQPYAFAMSMPVARATSTSMASVIDAEVQRILAEGYDMARKILREHSDQLEKLAVELMDREQLSRQEFEALLQE